MVETLSEDFRDGMKLIFNHYVDIILLEAFSHKPVGFSFKQEMEQVRLTLPLAVAVVEMWRVYDLGAFLVCSRKQMSNCILPTLATILRRGVEIIGEGSGSAKLSSIFRRFEDLASLLCLLNFGGCSLSHGIVLPIAWPSHRLSM